ncbi:MAG: hypothetical protein J5898_04530 [Lachnospiraceae bacterium]|nr:hypothetical protein [Lachnospiraceae bacterium]
MRYELGNMDRYSIAVMGTVMENSSFMKAMLDETVDADRLMKAVKTALEYHPLFKCKMSYDKQYYLEDNDNAELILFNVDTHDRPKEYGKNTNGYLFQVCYFENTVSLEWCHAVTDGRGASRFFSTVLDSYFGVELPGIPEKFPLSLGYESIYDKSVKPRSQIKQPAGFRAKDMEVIDNGYKCISHILRVKTDEVLKVTKKIGVTPSTVLIPLFCRAIREHLPKNAKKRNVSCGIIVDCRKPMKMDTMHNFVYNKVITYQDKFDSYDLSELGTIYREILDLFVQPENIIWACTDMKDSTDFLYTLRPLKLQRILMKIVAKIIKRTMNNIGFSYLGRVPFSEKVKSHLKDFDFRSWTDIGDCVISAADLNGTLILDICENYADKGVIDSFVSICKNFEINLEETETTIFEQANLRL